MARWKHITSRAFLRTARETTLVGLLMDISYSAWTLRVFPVKPTARQLGLPPNAVVLMCWAPDETRFLSPEGKPIKPHDLELGMRLILRGELTVSDSEASIDSPEVRLVSWKLYLPPARLKGQLVEVDEDTGGCEGKLKSANRVVRVKLRRKVRLIGTPRWQRSFQQHRLLGLKLGMELEVRGYWCPWAGPLDAQGRTIPDLVFVEQIRILKE